MTQTNYESQIKNWNSILEVRRIKQMIQRDCKDCQIRQGKKPMNGRPNTSQLKDN